MWPIEPFTTMSMPFIEMPQRADGVAVDDEQAAAAGRAGATAWRRPSRARARHHVLGDARPGIAVDHDVGAACSCRRSSSRRALDLDADRRVEPAGDGVRARRGLSDVPVRSRWCPAPGACSAG